MGKVPFTFQQFFCEFLVRVLLNTRHRFCVYYVEQRDPTVHAFHDMSDEREDLFGELRAVQRDEDVFKHWGLSLYLKCLHPMPQWPGCPGVLVPGTCGAVGDDSGSNKDLEHRRGFWGFA